MPIRRTKAPTLHGARETNKYARGKAVERMKSQQALDRRIRDLKRRIDPMIKAEKERKKALQSLTLPKEWLYTQGDTARIAEPELATREWVVQESTGEGETIVFPVVVKKSEYGLLPGTVVRRPWRFEEARAHRLSFDSWTWAAFGTITDARDFDPYFIELETPTQDENGSNVIGFIVGATSVLAPAPEKGFIAQLGLGRTMDSMQGAMIDGVPVPPSPYGIVSTNHTNKPVIGSQEIASSSNPQQKYVVTIYDDMMISCTCPGWANLKKCKHRENKELETLWSNLKIKQNANKKKP